MVLDRHGCDGARSNLGMLSMLRCGGILDKLVSGVLSSKLRMLLKIDLAVQYVIKV